MGFYLKPLCAVCLEIWEPQLSEPTGPAVVSKESALIVRRIKSVFVHVINTHTYARPGVINATDNF